MSTNARQAADEDKLVDIIYLGQRLTVVKRSGLYYYTDDQIIPAKLVTSELNAILPRTMLMGSYLTYRSIPWPGNVVNYVLEGGAGVQTIGSKVEKAVTEWNAKNTGIKFQRYASGQSNLAIYPTKGLLVFDLSPANIGNVTYGLGYPGDDVENLRVTLSPTVSINTILHEMMHVVGVGHEHQRGIRSQYIGIDQAAAARYNISPGDLLTQLLNKSDRFIFNNQPVDNFPFDYNSITIYDMPGLLYSLNPVKSISRSPTLTEKDVLVARKISNYNTVPELRLRNNNFATLWVPIHVKEGNTVTYELRAGGPDLVFTYDPVKGYYTLDGKQVDYVDLNNGASSDDIKFASYLNRITYKPNKSGDYWLINNYNNRVVDNNRFSPPFNQETTEFNDDDGIAGKGSARLQVYSVMPNENYGFKTYITISTK